MARRRKKGKKARISKHHIIPRSRGGTKTIENIVGLDVEKHRAYHILFGNRLPVEIVENLVVEFWGGQWNYVNDAYNNFLSYSKNKYEDGKR